MGGSFFCRPSLCRERFDPLILPVEQLFESVEIFTGNLLMIVQQFGQYGVGAAAVAAQNIVSSWRSFATNFTQWRSQNSSRIPNAAAEITF